MKKYRRMLAIVASCALVTFACTEDPSALNTPVEAARLIGIQLDVGEALAWPYRQEASADLDGDGQSETVTLASDVQLSASGAPLWEDGHRWALLVRDSAQSTIAYSAFVPRGFVEVAVLRPSSDGTRELLVQERTPEQLRSMTIAYASSGAATATAAAYYQLESWLPHSATLR